MFQFEDAIFKRNPQTRQNAPSHGKSTQKLELERFGLSNSRKTTVVDLFGIELDCIRGEVESLLDDRGQFSDATTLFSQNRLGASGADDDFCADGSHTDFDARVTVLGEFTGQEFIEFSKEDAIGDKLEVMSDERLYLFLF